MTDTQPPAAPAGRAQRLPALWWLFAAIGTVIGVIVGLIIPPPYPDGQWWGPFLTSAGFGGSLAVVGASIAAVIAFHNSRSDRRQKQDADALAQWWGRFTWACEKAVSTKRGESEMGLSVLTALIDAPWARDEDNEMAIGVANVINDAMNAAPNKRWWQR
ncbi:MAG: hypothetical protein CMH35_02745 [Microbacterium sp.]|nr:hypothetical protein [Microbacterium sp.]